MNKLTFTLDPAQPLPDKPIGSTDMEVGGTVNCEGETSFPDIKFTFSIQGNASAKAFNSIDDEDSDGILGREAKIETGFGEVKLPPQITLTTDSAWLKYRYAAKAKVQVSGSISPVDFKVDGSKEAIFGDYRHHSRDEILSSAILEDIKSLRFAANADDAFKLKKKEALSYLVRGELSASVTLGWSDVFTSSLNGLTRLLKSSQMLAIKIPPLASVKFHVGIVDDFILVFTKGKDDNVRISVKKSKSRGEGITGSLAVSVKFENEDDLEKALENVFDAILGESISEIDKILAKVTFEDLSDGEKALVDELIERLGLEEVVQTLEDFKEHWKAIKGKIEEIITQTAKAKVELGFTYEYLRVRMEDKLLSVNVDEKTFRRIHKELMLCDIRGLLDWIQNNPDALETYLNQKTLQRSKAWGFSLGIGPWKFAGKDKENLNQVVQKDTQGAERIAYLGMRSYESSWLKDKAKWTVDFKAQMKDFSRHQTPLACEFQYGLHFRWSWSEKKLKEKELQGYLDSAAVWRALAMGNIGEISTAVKSELKREANVSTEFTIDDDVLRELLPIVSKSSNDDLGAKALAKAMPYNGMFDGRRSPMLREMAYAPLWKFYFLNDSMGINAYSKTAAKEIAKLTQMEDEKSLAAYERGRDSNSPAHEDFYTFAGQIYHNGRTTDDFSGIHTRWLEFIQGLKMLDSAVAPNSSAPHGTIEEAFKHLCAFWNQSLHVRAAGIYLLDIAASHSDLIKRINRTCTISLKDGDTYTIGTAV